MSAEDFFDHVARTLAETMPRRRAVRLIGISLAAAAVPGVRPARARARTKSQAAACSHGTDQANPYQNVCDKNLPDRTVEQYCCGPPKWQYGCGSPVKGDCANSCPPRANLGNRVVEQYPCTSTKPDAQGQFSGKCCVKPESHGCSPDGECLPNCPYLYRFGGGLGPIPCGKTCCPTYMVCVDGECQPCEKFGGHTCQPAKKGALICCKKGTTCCFNKTTTACCGPKQTCRAQNVTTATCACKKGEGKKCGPDCCKKGETCTGAGCCPSNRVCPTGQKESTCCDGQDEYCFFKADPDLTPLAAKPRDIGTCKKGCAPGNKAGTQCCGTGYKPNRSKTRCVPS